MTPRPTLLALAAASSLLGSVLPGRALADDTKGAGDQRSADQTAYTFEDDLVNGDTARPNVEVLHVRKRGAKESLIRARLHFIPELLKTSESL